MIEEVFDEDSAVKSNQQIQQQVSDILTQLINYAGEYIQTEDTSILDLIEQSLTRSSQLKLSALIIDFSGVYKVDGIVVDSLE